MKKILCFLFAIAMTVSIQSLAQQSPEKLDHLNKVETYRKMKSAGATLTVLGGVLFAIGAATMYNSDYVTTLQAGTLTTILGIGGLSSGIPMWAVGAHNQRKYNKKLEGLSVRINATLPA